MNSVSYNWSQRAQAITYIRDDEGRVADLHAMRTTLGTNLARAGVALQVAQRIMRHSDYKTTLRHYTVLGLNDITPAIQALPEINTENDLMRATGTASELAEVPTHVDTDVRESRQLSGKCQLKPQQSGRESMHRSAAACKHDRSSSSHGKVCQPAVDADLCDTIRHDATIRMELAGVTQLVECQPSKLNVEGSSPFARFLLTPGDTRRREAQSVDRSGACEPSC